MSDAASDEESEPSTARKALRTVTPPYRSRPDAEMTIIGIAYFLGLVILLIPLLPFIVIVWLVSKGIGFVRRQSRGA